jgi:type VI secretion system protein ImpK
VERSIGVYGQDMLSWACLLRLAPQRPQAQVLLQQANNMLDELKRSQETLQTPVQAAEDGQFAICCAIDEIAMSLPDLRPIWSQYAMQATRFNTTNGGVELFERLRRVRQSGPPSVLATYAVVLGIGFQGCYGLPGADRYQLEAVRRELGVQLGVDPDRDWKGGVLRRVRAEDVKRLELFKVPWYRALWLGRAIAALLLLSAVSFGLWMFGVI